MDERYRRETQALEPSQTPASPTPTQYATAPPPLSQQGPPSVVRLPNPEGNYPNENLRKLVNTKIIPKFEELYGLIGQANALAEKEIDRKFWSPVLLRIQNLLSGFVPTMGGRRKSRRRRSRR